MQPHERGMLPPIRLAREVEPTWNLWTAGGRVVYELCRRVASRRRELGRLPVESESTSTRGGWPVSVAAYARRSPSCDQRGPITDAATGTMPSTRSSVTLMTIGCQRPPSGWTVSNFSPSAAQSRLGLKMKLDRRRKPPRRFAVPFATVWRTILNGASSPPT